jgi:hypothetical protein
MMMYSTLSPCRNRMRVTASAVPCIYVHISTSHVCTYPDNLTITRTARLALYMYRIICRLLSRFGFSATKDASLTQTNIYTLPLFQKTRD